VQEIAVLVAVFRLAAGDHHRFWRAVMSISFCLKPATASVMR
jgi:hypothetical protein